jgi:hypothetical protein
MAMIRASYIGTQYVKNQIEDILAKTGTSSRLQAALWTLTSF